MVVARTPEAYRSLVGQLRGREVVRTYRVLVLGPVEADAGVVDAPIGRSVSAPTRMAVVAPGARRRAPATGVEAAVRRAGADDA